MACSRRRADRLRHGQGHRAGRRRSSASSCSTRPAGRRTSTAHESAARSTATAAPIGDVRISVTDRCNFRCQYCMPAEGLPWLDRDALLTYEEIARLVALLASMGVHDVRLTGGEPLVRRELWRLVEMLSALEDVHDLSLTTNGYLLDAPGRRPRARRAAARQRLARLARARPLLPAHAPRLARSRCSTGWRPPRRHPELRPIKVNVVALQGLHRGRGRALRRVRAPAALRGALHRVHAARRRPHVERATACCPTRRSGALIDAAYPLEAARPRAPRHLAALALRRRPGRDRLHLPRHASRSAATATASA